MWLSVFFFFFLFFVFWLLSNLLIASSWMIPLVPYVSILGMLADFLFSALILLFFLQRWDADEYLFWLFSPFRTSI